MGIEPILPKKRDFESRASTNSATPACRCDAREVDHFPTIVKSMREFMCIFFELLSSLLTRCFTMCGESFVRC